MFDFQISHFTFRFNFGGFSVDQFLIAVKRMLGSNLMRCKTTNRNAIKSRV